MPKNQQPSDGKPGTTDQWPRWEGREETRPAGYLPAKDDPNAKDAQPISENDLSRDERVRLRAYDRWERRGRPEGTHDEDWFAAAQDIDAEICEIASPVNPEMSGGPVPAVDPFDMVPKRKRAAKKPEKPDYH
jgi:hypothetical protein